MQLALACDEYAKNEEECQQQILQIEQKQEKDRQELEQICILKRQQEIKRGDEYAQKKLDLEARIVAERDAKVAKLFQENNEIFTREVADMAGRLSSEKVQDDEYVRVAYEAFNTGAETGQTQIQALQATRCCQKIHEDNELFLLQQEIQAEQEIRRRQEEIQDRLRAIEEKKQKIEKMIQETKEEEEILGQLQQEKTVGNGNTATFKQGAGADNSPDDQIRVVNSFRKQRGKLNTMPMLLIVC